MVKPVFRRKSIGTKVSEEQSPEFGNRPLGRATFTNKFAILWNRRIFQSLNF